jgi:hypothetical protein
MHAMQPSDSNVCLMGLHHLQPLTPRAYNNSTNGESLISWVLPLQHNRATPDTGVAVKHVLLL